MSCALTALLTFAACGPPAESARPPDPGLAALSAWEALPRLTSARYEQYSSHDPERRLYPFVDPANKDFNNFIAVCGDAPAPATPYQELEVQAGDAATRAALCPAGVEGHLLAQVGSGPGFVSRVWITATRPFAGPPGFDDEQLLFYVDDPTTPVHRAPLARWQRAPRDADQLAEPLAGWWSGAVTSYLPVSFRSRLWVTLANVDPQKVYYYQVDLQHLAPVPIEPAPAATLQSQAERALTTARRARDGHRLGTVRAVDRTLVVDAASPTLLLDSRGPATLTRLELRLPLQLATLETLRALALRLRWEETDRPAVALSVAELFGLSGADPRQPISTFETLPLAVRREGDQLVLVSFLPAPFARRARVGLANHGPRPLRSHVRIDVAAGVAEGRWGYLHAHLSERSGPQPAGSRHEVLNVTGAGRYIGTLLTSSGHRDPQQPLSHPLGLLEGDERAVIDGEPRVLGTGTEDYFNAGFYFLDGRFAHPFAALVALASDDTRGAVTAARFHVLTDAIDFSRAFELSFEYGAGRPDLVDRYTSVALFYLASP